MRKMFSAALLVALSAVTVLAGGIPNPSATAVEVGGVMYWFWQGVLYVMF